MLHIHSYSMVVMIFFIQSPSVKAVFQKKNRTLHCTFSLPHNSLRLGTFALVLVERLQICSSLAKEGCVNTVGFEIADEKRHLALGVGVQNSENNTKMISMIGIRYRILPQQLSCLCICPRKKQRQLAVEGCNGHLPIAPGESLVIPVIPDHPRSAPAARLLLADQRQLCTAKSDFATHLPRKNTKKHWEPGRDRAWLTCVNPCLGT